MHTLTQSTSSEASSERLKRTIAEHPQAYFREWRPVGPNFLAFMSDAIYGAWKTYYDTDEAFPRLRHHAETYMRLMYDEPLRDRLITDFVNKTNLAAIQSGEFDSLSYAFFFSLYEMTALETADEQGRIKRHRFTQHVGRLFYDAMASHLGLDLPERLRTDDDFAKLNAAIMAIGNFLLDERYLYNRFAFLPDVIARHQGQIIEQDGAGFRQALGAGNVAYAIYEMGYPIILPSATCLYLSEFGEAQHHSSRIIEELFRNIGYEAHETEDFNPTEHRPDTVIELWKIRKMSEP